MKKNIIKLISAAVIASAIAVPTTSAIFGEYDPDKVVNPNEQSTKMISNKNSIIINGEIIEDVEVIDSDNILMFPARKVFEELGYTVEWQNETHSVIVAKMPHYITFTIGTDGYTFAKTAPMPLNKAPELINGLTYVPVNLLTEILEMDVKIDVDYNLIINDTIDIEEETESQEESEESTDNFLGEGAEESTELSSETDETELSDKTIENKENVNGVNVEVVSIEKDSILIDDPERGEVSLVIGEDTEIVFDDETEASVKDIKEKSNLYVEYNEAMTESIPPINNPKKIVISTEISE